MPFYEIHHSLSLTPLQRQSLASAITKLHCSTFKTPSFFVHVNFRHEDASSGAYFMAGKVRTVNSNRIIAIVRTSASRQKSDFDDLGERIEQAWYEIVAGTIEDEEKRLLMVTFTPMITIREGGMPIPEAGQEGSWLKEQMAYFKDLGTKKGIRDFQELLQEIKEGDDLK